MLHAFISDPLVLCAIGTAVVLGGILLFRLHAFVALFLGALIVAWLTPADNIRQFAAASKFTAQQAAELVQQSVGDRLANGFGGTCKIGLLIALASILGKALLDSGAADRIVRTMIRAFGERRAALAFLLCGFVLGISISLFTVFYLLIPLGKVMGIRHPRNYLLYVLAIVTGTSITFSLVPPNPGPASVAGILGIPVGTMMLAGIGVGLFTTILSYFYAVWANHRWPVPVRETTDVSLTELKALAGRDESELPRFWLSMLPIVVPVLLIAIPTIAAVKFDMKHNANFAVRFLTDLGNSNIALTIGAAIALGILAAQKQMTKKKITAAVETALAGAGVIILITAVGGAFGEVLQQTGVGPRIQELAHDRIAVLPLAFLVTMFLRTAQGSATVAMIATAGIFKGLATPAALGFHPVYLALAIGCGSKPFSWMNDSGFWLIGKIAGLTEVETLKTFSAVLAVLGFVGIVVVMILARYFPFS